MKRFKNAWMLIPGLITGLSAQSQTDTVIYEIGTWDDFRTSAITYTFDDNCSNQYTKAVPMFDALGFKGTFYTVTGADWTPPAQWNVLEQMAANGHEIGSHCVTHTSLYGLRASVETKELKNSRDSINAHVPSQQCITMSYPYCAVGDKELCAKYYISARGCQGYVEGKTPGDILNVSSIICGSAGTINSVAAFKESINSAVNKKGWCVFLIHGIDDDPGGYSPLASGVLDNSLKYCDIRNYKCWVSTFANVSKYIMERNSASVAVLSASDSTIVLQVTDTMPDSLYNYPLTLRRPLPPNWPSAEVTQNDVPVGTFYSKIDTVVYLIFHAVPDGGDVKLTLSNEPFELTDMDHEDEDTIGEPEIPSAIRIDEGSNSSSGGELKLMYRSGELMFELPPGSGGDVALSLYSTSGILLATYEVRNMSHDTGRVRMPDDIDRQGIYIVQVSNFKRTWCGKLVF
jgi:peptidoglycan-N-acetylglucosamine deacetylase